MCTIISGADVRVDATTRKHVRSVSGQKESLAGDPEGLAVHPVSVAVCHGSAPVCAAVAVADTWVTEVNVQFLWKIRP